MAEYLIQDTTLTGIADAIRGKTGETGAIPVPDMASKIDGIQTGGGGSDEGWIGDGNTHIWIHLEEGRTSPMLGCCPNGTVTVDWGDGTTPNVLTGTSVTSVKWTPNHEYAEPGDYVIRLTVDGTMGLYGNSKSNSYYSMLKYNSSTDTRNLAYSSIVTKVEIGSGVTAIGPYTFYGCCSLTSVVIPDSVTSIDGYAFYDCCNLTSVVIPEGVTRIGSYMFYGCRNLTSVVIPDGVTSIGSYAFSGCRNLTSLVIPATVTSIGDRVFEVCYALLYCDFSKHTAVPTLSHANTIQGVTYDCQIRVPAALYDEWIAATNWSSAGVANKIVAV